MSRVLVAYESKHKGTAELAERIAETLRARGLDVDLRRAADVTAVGEYSAVVLGSGVYAGRWLPAARRLLRRETGALAERDLWLFSSGPAGNEPDELAKAAPPAVAKAAARLGARDHAVFGGRVPPDPHGPFERMVVRMWPKGKPLDGRDFAAVERWADGIAAALQRHRQPVAS
jgi:menaquinone-dependent protoporphyrinogen oxidase